jgi:hypothetical protein
LYPSGGSFLYNLIWGWMNEWLSLKRKLKTSRKTWMM